jgi:hypothetical protein
LPEKIPNRSPGNTGTIGQTLTNFSALCRFDTKNDLFVPDSMYVSSVSRFGLLSVEVAMQLLVSLYDAAFSLEYHVLDPLSQADSGILSISAVDACSRSSLPEKLPLACSSAEFDLFDVARI